MSELPTLDVERIAAELERQVVESYGLLPISDLDCPPLSRWFYVGPVELYPRWSVRVIEGKRASGFVIANVSIREEDYRRRGLFTAIANRFWQRLLPGEFLEIENAGWHMQRWMGKNLGPWCKHPHQVDPSADQVTRYTLKGGAL